MFDDNGEETIVENLIAQNLAAHKLSILPESELTDIVADYVIKQDKDSIFNYLNRTIDATKTQLDLNDELEDDKKLQDAIVLVKEARLRDYEQHVGERTTQRVTNNSLTINTRDYDRNVENVDLRKYGLDSSQKGFVAKRVIMKKGSATRKPAVSRRKREDDDDESPVQKRPKAAVAKRNSKKVISESEDEISIDGISEEEVQQQSSSRAKPTPRTKAAVAKKTVAAKTPKQTTIHSFEKMRFSEVVDIDDEIQVIETPPSSTLANPPSLTESNNDIKKKKALPSSFGSQKSKPTTSTTGRKVRQNRFG
jgi:hypothetical protein